MKVPFTRENHIIKNQNFDFSFISSSKKQTYVTNQYNYLFMKIIAHANAWAFPLLLYLAFIRLLILQFFSLLKT